MRTIEEIYHFKVEDDNRVSKLEEENFSGQDYLVNISGAAMCVFNSALYVFGNFEVGAEYRNKYSYVYRTDKWHQKDSFRAYGVPTETSGIKRATASVIKDTLGLFYVNYQGRLYYQYMTTDGNWSSPKKLSDHVITDTYNYEWDEFLTYGNIASTTYTINNEVIYILAVTGIKHNDIKFWYIDSKGDVLDTSTHPTSSMINVALTDGSVSGGGHGRPIQCFYSYSSGYSCRNKIARVDFYPETKVFKPHETFNMCTNVADKTFLPSCTEYIDEAGSSSLHKKIVMSYVDYGKNMFDYIPKFNFYVWDSDKLKLIKETKDTTLESFHRLIGVVEGPPPYVLNGYSMSDISGMGFDDISEINLGKTYEQGQTSTNGTQSTITFKNEIFGISAGFSQTVSKENTYKSEFKHSTSQTLIPFSGQLLMKIILIPHFDKKYFAIQDYSGNAYDTISSIKCTNTTISYRTDHLSKTNQGLNLEDITTYMDRNIDFDAYNHVYETAFQHVTGTRTSSQLSMDKEYTYTNSYSLKITPGGHNIGDSLGFFKLATKSAYKTSIEITTTTKMSRELNLTLHCPGGDKDGDILSYKGLFHWLEYTEGEDNWWIIDGFKDDKPWCMTYEIFSFEKYKE